MLWNRIQRFLGALFILLCVLSNTPVHAQESGLPVVNGSDESVQAETATGPINVHPTASDKAIENRLRRILKATQWFEPMQINVQDGVVFLEGRTTRKAHKEWASQLATQTLDVVAVVNRMEVIGASPWDISPAIDELSSLWKTTVQKLPRLGVGLLCLVVVLLVAKGFFLSSRRLLQPRLKPLLRDVTARLISILVFIIGFYMVLQIAGLSGLAATVLGGTGLAGLVAGIAFRDILENFLASVLISLRNPFKIGDLVEIDGNLGLVQRVTTRGTMLMNPDGNHVQIPNATVYKSIIHNFTANPNRREQFAVGIGFENNIPEAQQIALEVLIGHPAILKEPEPLILVDALGSATVNLNVYFWYDGLKHNGFKVKSSVIRLVKSSFEQKQISMPDEAREIIFPDGVPVEMITGKKTDTSADKPPSTPVEKTTVEATVSEAEGNLTSEDGELSEQARTSRIPEEGTNLFDEQ